MTAFVKKCLVLTMVFVLILSAGCMSELPSDAYGLRSVSENGSTDAEPMETGTDDEEPQLAYINRSSDYTLVDAKIYTIDVEEDKEAAPKALGEAAVSESSVAMDYAPAVVGEGVQIEAVVEENHPAPAIAEPVESAVSVCFDDAVAAEVVGEGVNHGESITIDIPAPPMGG